MKHLFRTTAIVGLLAGSVTAVQADITAVRYLNQETNPDVVSIQRGWVEDFVAQNPDLDVILEGAPASVINQRIATYVQAVLMAKVGLSIVADLQRRGIGVLITDHNVHETLAITDRAYLLSEGEIYKEGTPQELAEDAEVRRRYLGEKFTLERYQT